MILNGLPWKLTEVILLFQYIESIHFKDQKEIFGPSTSPFKEGRMEMSQERYLIFSRLNYCKEQPSCTTSAMAVVVVV